MNEQKIIRGLNDLLAKNYDAEQGFDLAFGKTESPMLKAFFNNKMAQRYAFGHQIKDILREMEADIDKGSSLVGEMHKAWFNFKTFFTGNSEESILEEVENGEEACLEEYNEFLENKELPHSIRRIITSQRNLVAKSLRKVEEYEEIFDED